MTNFASTPTTAFRDSRRLARGPLAEVSLAVKAAQAAYPEATFLTFDDRTGKVIDLDLRGGDEEVLRRLDMPMPGETNSREGAESANAGKRGRPKLGVVPREVTLLPRHWDWLAGQPGGASQALRRLVDRARSADDGKNAIRVAQETAYRFMAAMAGDLPSFEEASRALFAGDSQALAERMSDWPSDIRDHTLTLAGVRS